MAAPEAPAALIAEVAANFSLPGRLVSAQRWGSGHINDSYAAVYELPGGRRRYLHQRVNLRVFKEPEKMMGNVERVAAHLRAKAPPGRALTLVPAKGGGSFWNDPQAGFWRTFEFIEGAVTVDSVEGPERAREAGRAFGAFQRLLADLKGPRLHEVIPAFHDTEARLKALEAAAVADAHNRAASAKAELDFALRRRELGGLLERLRRAGGLPERVTHNDTKINNVLFDAQTGAGVCVVDLDTVMPGLVCHDFGDMVRDWVSPAPEDERDLSKVRVRRDVFEALSRGYLSEAGSFLTPGERSSLAAGGKVIALELGARFLSDYLSGDVYFKTRRPGHNLDRARAQFKLLERLEAEEEALTRILERG